MPQVDPELFDRGQFQAELALKASPIAAFKKAIRQAREVLDERFLSGRDIRRLIEDRAWFVDNILQKAWEQFNWSEDADIALVAVGGYGRGELHPYSDIDLLILLDSADHEIFRDSIERFLTLLWDIGLEVGQSVRSVDECAEEARADLTVITNLMESRTIAGPERLRQRMLEVTSTAHMWPSKDFFLAKRTEQKARHHKYNDTEYNLEPNVKGLARRAAGYPDDFVGRPPPVRHPEPARPGRRRLPGRERKRPAGLFPGIPVESALCPAHARRSRRRPLAVRPSALHRHIAGL